MTYTKRDGRRRADRLKPRVVKSSGQHRRLEHSNCALLEKFVNQSRRQEKEAIFGGGLKDRMADEFHFLGDRLMSFWLRGEVPDYAVSAPAEFPIWAGAPRQYRFDGQTGLFCCGSNEPIGAMLIQPIDYRWREGERWGRNYQAWLDVAFVDSDGCVAQLSLKKDSAINLFELFVSLKSVNGKEVALPAIEIGLEAAEHLTEREDGTEGIFYVVQVGAVDYLDEHSFQPVQDFAQSGQFQWQLVGEVNDSEASHVHA
jgi:hypothetical protein